MLKLWWTVLEGSYIMAVGHIGGYIYIYIYGGCVNVEGLHVASVLESIAPIGIANSVCETKRQ